VERDKNSGIKQFSAEKNEERSHLAALIPISLWNTGRRSECEERRTIARQALRRYRLQGNGKCGDRGSVGATILPSHEGGRPGSDLRESFEQPCVKGCKRQPLASGELDEERVVDGNTGLMGAH